MTTYYVKSPGAGTASGDSWANAMATVATALAAATPTVIYVASTHAYTAGAAITWTCPTTPAASVQILSVTEATPVTTLTAGASESVGAANAAFNVSGFAYIYGMSLLGGSTSGTASDIILGQGALAAAQILDTCRLVNQNANTGALITIGNVNNAANDDSEVRLVNTAVKFASTSGINVGWGRVYIRGLSIELGTDATNLFTPIAATSGTVLIEDSDLTGDTYTNLVNVAVAAPHVFTFRNCKLPNVSGSTIANGTNPGQGGPIVRVHNASHDDTHFRLSEHSYQGTVTTNTSNYRTAGAVSSDTTPFSLLMTQDAAKPLFWSPLESPEIWVYNTQTGSLTIDVQFMRDSATDFDDDELWMEIHYMGTSGTPYGLLATTRAASVLATPAAVSSAGDSAWTETVANQNFNKLTKAVTVNEAGYIIVKVMLNSGTSGDSVYVDPYITVSGDTNTYKVNLIPGMGFVMQPTGSGGSMGISQGLHTIDSQVSA